MLFTLRSVFTFRSTSLGVSSERNLRNERNVKPARRPEGLSDPAPRRAPYLRYFGLSGKRGWGLNVRAVFSAWYMRFFTGLATPPSRISR